MVCGLSLLTAFNGHLTYCIGCSTFRSMLAVCLVRSCGRLACPSCLGWQELEATGTAGAPTLLCAMPMGTASGCGGVSCGRARARDVHVAPPTHPPPPPPLSVCINPGSALKVLKLAPAGHCVKAQPTLCARGRVRTIRLTPPRSTAVLYGIDTRRRTSRYTQPSRPGNQAGKHSSRQQAWSNTTATWDTGTGGRLDPGY